MTTTINETRDAIYSRPNARFDADGTLEIRASAVGNCRRALWYEANEHPVTNARTEESLTMLEAGNALEPVVLRAMRRAGWEIDATDKDNPEMMSMRLGPNLVVTGHVDATGVVPIFGEQASVIEIKTRGPEAFKRWRTLGAERSHPESVAQAAFYSYGDLRRGAGRGDRDDGHRLPPVGLRGDPSGAGRHSIPPGLRAAGDNRRPPRIARAGTLRPCRSGTSPPTTGSANAAPSSTPACRGRRRNWKPRTNPPRTPSR